MTTHTAYLPTIRRDHPPRQLRAERGIAWCPGWSIPHIRRDFHAPLYFHSATWEKPGNGAIPIIRTKNNQQQGEAGSWPVLLPKLLDLRYVGPVIFGNEPGHGAQDNTPPDDFIAEYHAACRLVRGSGIHFIVGNYMYHTGTVYFANHANLRKQDVIGLHLYQIWEDFRYPARVINHVLKQIRNDHRHRIWITEYGVSREWSDEQIRRYVDEVELHPDVAVAMAYTAHSDHERYNFYKRKQGREFTKVGRIFNSIK